MIHEGKGISQVEYIILATIILGVVGAVAWQLARAIASKLDSFRSSL
jgi:ABC-type nitrate/sulfonate/bicarbonate transport system permease component